MSRPPDGLMEDLECTPSSISNEVVTRSPIVPDDTLIISPSVRSNRDEDPVLLLLLLLALPMLYSLPAGE